MLYAGWMKRTQYWKPDAQIVTDMVRWYEDGESCAQIGRRVGVDFHRVYHQLRKAGVSLRSPAGAVKPMSCRRCGAGFSSSGNNALFCSKRCQYGESQCEWCDQTFTRRPPSGGYRDRPRGRENVFCSKACEARGRQVREDRHVRPDGYVLFRVPKDWHWHGDGPFTRVKMEHRVVMAESLKRPLDPTETVHHINGVRGDNRPENLQIRQGKHGKGVVMVCNVCGSNDVGSVPIAK